MNAIDNIERTLEEWGQTLRGGASPHGLQPRDVLHAVLSTLEANRVEGLDHKMYAPNAHTLEIHLDEEERSRLLPFLGHEELEAAIQRYCMERKYHFRGPLSMQVVDAGTIGQSYDQSPPGALAPHTPEAPKKVVVHSRFDVSQNWQPDADRAIPETLPPAMTMSEHDSNRREIPSAPTRIYRS